MSSRSSKMMCRPGTDTVNRDISGYGSGTLAAARRCAALALVLCEPSIAPTVPALVLRVRKERTYLIQQHAAWYLPSLGISLAIGCSCDTHARGSA